jgi:hypothetical protein
LFSAKFVAKATIAAATAITAAGFLAVPTPAHARPMIPLPLAPPCSQYVFTGGFSLRADAGPEILGSQTFFSSTGPTTVGGRAVNVSDDNVHKRVGNVSGGIQGRNVDFTINWDGGGDPWHFTGTVGADGLVHHGVASINGNPGGWDSINGPLNCGDPAAPPPPPPGPNDQQVVLAPGVQNAPPHELGPQTPAPPAKPLQGPTVSAQPGLTGVTFHVTDRSGVASQCTYSSEGFTSASFSLPANGSFDLFVPAIRQFRNRTGTVTCDNGTSASTSVFF